MKVLLAPLAALALAATAQARSRPDPPIRFEISRDGRVIWRGEIAPAAAEAPELRFQGLCPEASADRADMRMSLGPTRDPASPRGGRHEYAYSFGWTRSYDPDPRRLDACGPERVRSSYRSGVFWMGRHGRFTSALPDGLSLTLER